MRLRRKLHHRHRQGRLSPLLLWEPLQRRTRLSVVLSGRLFVKVRAAGGGWRGECSAPPPAIHGWKRGRGPSMVHSPHSPHHPPPAPPSTVPWTKAVRGLRVGGCGWHGVQLALRSIHVVGQSGGRFAAAARGLMDRRTREPGEAERKRRHSQSRVPSRPRERDAAGWVWTAHMDVRGRRFSHGWLHRRSIPTLQRHASPTRP